MLYSQHEGRQAKFVNRRTDYEEAEGKEVFQWQPGISLADVRLGKAVVRPEGGRRRFGYFAAEGKVTRAYGAEYP